MNIEKLIKNSSFFADFGFTKIINQIFKKKKKNINHFFSKFKLNLNLENFNSSNLYFKLEKVTNDTYLKVFDKILQNE